MRTPEIPLHRFHPVAEHLKNPLELSVIVAFAYVGLLIGSRLGQPALNNFIEFANTILGK